MATHDLEHERTNDETATRPAARPVQPEAPLAHVASQVGNNAFTQLIRRGDVRLAPAGAVSVARQDEEEEDPGLDDGQKARLRAMVIAPLRANAGRLDAGERADVRSIVGHLQPAQSALRAFAARGETQTTLTESAEDLATTITVLRSLNLNRNQVVFLSRSSWQTARRHLAATKRELHRLGHPPRGQAPPPPADVRAAEEGEAHLEALSQQIAASIDDLNRARTPEQLGTVLDTADQIIEQFDSFTAAGTIPPSFTAAKAAFAEGTERIVPLAIGKEEAIKSAQLSLYETANNLAPLADAERVEAPEPPPEPSTPQAPAPPGPSPLPPPPPPPPRAPVPATP